MSRSYPALGRYYPEDLEFRGVHVCNDPHIPCKTRNTSRTPGKSECISIQRSQDAIYQPYEWRILGKQKQVTDQNRTYNCWLKWRGIGFLLLLLLLLFSHVIPTPLSLFRHASTSKGSVRERSAEFFPPPWCLLFCPQPSTLQFRLLSGKKMNMHRGNSRVPMNSCPHRVFQVSGP